jgi:hypothetical protein
MNLDETAVTYAFPGINGNVLCKKEWSQGAGTPKERFRKADL